MIAKRMQAIKPSPTLSLSQKASDMKRMGHDVLNLSAGEPDFATPSWICDGAKKAMDQGQTRYTAVGGTPELKDAILKKLKRDQNLTYTPQEIIVSTGGKQVLFNLLLATINPKDEVIIPAPYWVSYSDMVLIAQGHPVIVPCGPDINFKLTPTLLEKAITNQTKWLILNSPSNPTGMVYSAQELKELAGVLEKYPHVHIISDDIYEHILYDCAFVNLLNVAPHLKSRTFLVNGLSKAYNMTGWRLGYGAGPKEWIESMVNLQSQSTSNPCSITQAAGIMALNGPQDFIVHQKDTFQKRRDLMVNLLKSCDLLDIYTPQGAFYLYVGCQKALGYKTSSNHLLATDGDVAQHLLTDAGVAVVPGEAFGFSPYLRLSYAMDHETLTKAAHRILNFFNKLIK